MDYRLVQVGEVKYVECLPDGWLITRDSDALDLVAACGEHDTDRLLLHADSLPAEFYNLKTGLAGAILLKFSNYFIRCAAVLPPELVNQGRFQEFALETNRGRAFRIFSDRDSAERWLMSLPSQG